MKNTKMETAKKAFTLIEILIVIAILGILADLLISSISSVRRMAKTVQCINNLRQIGLAWHLYLGDHDDRFPAYANLLETEFGGNGGAAGGKPAKNRILNPYVDINVNRAEAEVEGDPGLQIFHCPADSGSIEVFEVFGTSYATNVRVLKFGTAPNYSERPLSSITAPYDRLLLASEMTPQVPGHGGAPPRLRVNFLFMDGHVKTHFFTEDVDTDNNDANDPTKSVFLDPAAGNGQSW